MKNMLKPFWLFLLLTSAALTAQASYDVAAIIWPAYQPEPRWKELGIFEHGCGEWQNVYEAVSKKEGHVQPKVPLWGYENEANPIAVARKIDAALAAGINVFIYDWYWYQSRPFLEDGLNEGFLKAPNNERMKFFIMWANHDVNYLWNNKKADKKANPPLFDATVSFEEFEKIARRTVDMYFVKPNYYKIDGKPVFSFYILAKFVRGVGGMQKAKEALDRFQAYAREKGLPGVHFMVIGGFPSKVDGGVPGVEIQNEAEIAKYLDIDSYTQYNWTQSFKPVGEYKEWRDKNIANWDVLKNKIGITYFPNVTVGWDTNPRFPKEVYTDTVLNPTPADYEIALRAAKKWVDANCVGKTPKLIIVNSWNEWTEGGYLEPDAQFGYGYLNATARVFGPGAQQSQ